MNIRYLLEHMNAVLSQPDVIQVYTWLKEQPLTTPLAQQFFLDLGFKPSSLAELVESYSSEQGDLETLIKMRLIRFEGLCEQGRWDEADILARQIKSLAARASESVLKTVERRLSFY